MARIKTTAGGTLDLLVRDLRGKAVRTEREMANGNMRIPKGALCRVSSTWRSGVSLESPPCPHCGVSISISRVHRDDVILVVDAAGFPVKYGDAL